MLATMGHAAMRESSEEAEGGEEKGWPKLMYNDRRRWIS